MRMIVTQYLYEYLRKEVNKILGCAPSSPLLRLFDKSHISLNRLVAIILIDEIVSVNKKKIPSIPNRYYSYYNPRDYGRNYHPFQKLKMLIPVKIL